MDLFSGLGLATSFLLVVLAFVAGRDLRQLGAPMVAGISTCLLVLFLPILGVPLWLIARRRLICQVSA